MAGAGAGDGPENLVDGSKVAAEELFIVGNYGITLMVHLLYSLNTLIFNLRNPNPNPSPCHFWPPSPSPSAPKLVASIPPSAASNQPTSPPSPQSGHGEGCREAVVGDGGAGVVGEPRWFFAAAKCRRGLEIGM
ncbi:hypothetical protein Acr_00g0079400 [Actinidia rufa]|uniref:Uncharacterized protein n=1 Tax=Actinidia rufa TaxID=165716 RepID=A0A7J0DTS1_9ERIC|nr:hypothetical protein Acr_00g0079400 [Actinidia rufa]